MSRETLLKIIGFCSTNPTLNFNNFFTNTSLQKDIDKRVIEYTKKNNIVEKPELVSQYASLKIAELILSNKDTLNNGFKSIDEDELNIFKAFLVINSQLNGKQKFDNLNDDNFERLVDFYLISKFPESDLAIYENDEPEFVKLIYSTIYKVEELFKFLNSKQEFKGFKNQFIKSFKTNSDEEFIQQMKYLFGQLLISKRSKNYIFKVTDKTSFDFLKSMTSENIELDEDFTNLKNNPIYFIDNETFSVVNYFFAVDKFYRSTKFKLKEIYNKIEILKEDYGEFFGFFKKHFSENFLMKNVLDNIFKKKHFIKKPEREKELNGEPDYYVRHGNTIFLFENKDILVAKGIKSSADIEKINTYLQSRFVYDGERSVGISQLVNSIKEIQEKEFRFDDYVNKKNSLKIFPILIIQDRIFQCPGINYRLNNWYRKIVQDELKGKYNPSNINGLTVIDIDSLIVWTPYLKQKDKNFKEILINHLHRMERHKKINISDLKLGLYKAKQNLTERISSISSRQMPFYISKKMFLEKFEDVITK
ncbi:MAG: hypothetical protein H3C31_12385 [Brumimicrobium sp.]|nr:hypothetical protein [Brumimicrobium sp.]